MSITKIYRGTLHSLGHGVQNGRGATTVSVARIGDREIANLSYSAYLGTFIEDSLGEEVELGTVRIRGCPVVIGARFADGSVRNDTGALKLMLGISAVSALWMALAAGGLPILWILAAVFAWLARKPFAGLLLARKFKPTVRPE
ncbi:TPA: hypothetical protein ACYLN4_000312 [Burkholderia lata]